MRPNIYKFYRAIMSLTPETLLSKSSREQCISKLNELPSLLNDNDKREINAAVLLPLCVIDKELCILYTLRSSNLSSHSGQVSFPGGKMDKGESIYDTALRETEEEIGYSPKEIDIWTKMNRIPGRDPRVVVTPVVGQLLNFDIKKLRHNEDEVAEIFTVPIKVLCDPKNHACFVYNHISVPIFLYGKHKVWGITGMITHLFLQSLLSEDVYQGNFTNLEKKYTMEELLPPSNAKL